MSERRTEVLIPGYILDQRIRALAHEIAHKYWYALADASNSADSQEQKVAAETADLIIVCVLKGGVTFAVQLLDELAALGVDAQLEFVKASSYGNALESSGQVKTQVLFDGNKLKDQHVVVADDIFDTGLTLEEQVNTLASFLPASLLAVVMINKLDVIKVQIDAKLLFGIEIPKYWVQGRGIDTAEHGRGGQDILAVVHSDDETAEVIAFREMLIARFLATAN